MVNKAENKDIQLKQKVVVLLNRQQVDFLDKIGKDALFSGGGKLSRGRIISTLVDVLLERRDRINTKDIKDAQDLKEKIQAALKGTLKGTHTLNDFPSPYEILALKEQSLESKDKDKNG